MYESIQKTGRLLAHRIGQILKAQGYKTWIAKDQRRGIDLKVSHNGNLILVAEILNWSPYTYFSVKRKNRIIRNLMSYENCDRVLIYTTMRDETPLEDFHALDISIVKLDCQILPKHFYKFYEEKKQVTGRKIDSKESSQHIKTKLSKFMQTITLEVGILLPETSHAETVE
jgi:hypothetical protein